jgi:hypothetical protein
MQLGTCYFVEPFEAEAYHDLNLKARDVTRYVSLCLVAELPHYSSHYHSAASQLQRRLCLVVAVLDGSRYEPYTTLWANVKHG